MINILDLAWGINFYVMYLIYNIEYTSYQIFYYFLYCLLILDSVRISY